MHHAYQPDLDPQMAGDCAICGNRRFHVIHDVPATTLPQVRERLREAFGRTPFIGEAERLLSDLHARFSGGTDMVRLGDLMEGELNQASLDLVMSALTALSTSSFAVIDLIGLDRDGVPLLSGETYDRIRTGRQADETWLAVVARPGFTDLGSV
jgi:hypothetical protein